MVFGFKGKFPF